MTGFTPPADVAERWAYDRAYRQLEASRTAERVALTAELRALRGTPVPPVPDPERTAAALRRKAGRP